jgi:hypothetical protein
MDSPSPKDRPVESAYKDEEIENPAATFDRPSQIIKDRTLTEQEKQAALDNWEQDDRDLMTASDEGMREIDANQKQRGDDQLDEVLQAMRELGGKRTQKTSQ